MRIFSGRTSRPRMLKIGSLSLSVNAIVILVLGITMLGLGLAFTKGMFGKLAGKIEIPPPNIPATKDEPIVLPAEEVKWDKPSRDLALSVNIYNDHGNGEIYTAFVCDGQSVTSVAASNYVKADEYAPFKIILAGGQTITSGTYVCTIYMCIATPCDSTSAVDQKQITLKVS